MPSVSPGSIARFDPLWGSLALVQWSRILAGVAGVVVVFGRVNPDSEAAICRLLECLTLRRDILRLRFWDQSNHPI